MLKAGVIRPSSSPSWAPTFYVRKSNGDRRIVHDFGGFNAKVKVPANPIPRKDEILRAMAQGKLFSTMALLWCFYQVRLEEKWIPYTAFATPDGLFEYLVTQMGISSGLSSFNRLMCSIFSDCSFFCQTYFDNLFVFTETESIDVISQHWKRCWTGVHKNIYSSRSRYVSSASPKFPVSAITLVATMMDPKKAESIRNWPIPATKREIQAFLGTCVYVMRFCPGFSKQVALLTDVIRLNPQQIYSFLALKTKLTSPPVLAHPDFSKPFHVNVDADFAVGGYLFQVYVDDHENVIAYGDRKLSKPEMPYPTWEKELIATLHAMRTWKVYLLDRPFYLNADHQTLETILQ
ncbi:LOW QUALITY PROTEIN: Pol Polyprotein [Phytophthora megakarya]|uniref:Pol Polyprotein n=1 Tax=Phytophthora megakarya TaxID=4795 RepID=A0A225VFH4_9STRA|nr:LOW QUALITY PROTEIN: Pol Polyprotein [Phytophthora megakarya]